MPELFGEALRSQEATEQIMEGLRRFHQETEQEVGILTGISPNINAALLGLRFFCTYFDNLVKEKKYIFAM
jgi:hypothetical protein